MSSMNFNNGSKYIARFSPNHIKDDIKRNWSSWNFGQDGLEGTKGDIEQWRKEAIENENPFFISGFELFGEQIQFADIRQLYYNYWVLVDSEGLAGVELDSENLDDAINESKIKEYSGEGVSFCAETEYKLVWSCENNEIHIFEKI